MDFNTEMYLIQGSDILLVDDDADTLKQLTSILVQSGFDVRSATNGAQAIDAIQRQCPDLILLDIAMPDMSGLEVCYWIKNKSEYQNIPIIFITGKTSEEDIVTGFKVGAVDYINKPFNKRELTARVTTHLENKKAKDLLKQMNDDLTLKNEQLTEANATKDKFFSIIAHDLRSPFHSILSLSDTLISSIEKKNTYLQEEQLSVIKDAAKNGHNLLENLLEWANMNNGNIQFAPDKYHLKSMLNTAIELYQINTKNIVFVTEIHDPKAMIQVDYHMTETILRNLMGNSLKYSYPDSQIVVKTYPPENGFIKINIQDYGIGMSKDTLDSLFVINKRNSTPGTAHEKGTGLGLVLCHGFANVQGCKINVDSEQGKGSTFTVYFPVAN